jgi:chromate transporter
MIFLPLFYTFLLIGLFTFGGGYSMIALIYDEVVTRHAWITSAEFTDILAISQITPGPIGINTATYAGYAAVASAGYPTYMAVVGSLIASVAVILLPAALIIVVSQWLQHHKDNPTVAVVLRTLRIAVLGLIAAAALSLLTTENFGTPALSRQFITSVAIFVAVFILSVRYRKSPILLIAISGLAGLVVYSI